MHPNTRTTLFLSLCLYLLSPSLFSADYLIDTKDAHAFIQFRISHLGYSWVLGRFDSFTGSFSYDEHDPDASKVDVVVQTASIDTNHAERDKHLRGNKFLAVERYPEARFVSTAFTEQPDGSALLRGNLTAARRHPAHCHRGQADRCRHGPLGRLPSRFRRPHQPATQGFRDRLRSGPHG